MAGGGLLHLWSQHGVRFMVVCSFLLQLFLLARGGTRRRSSSAALRVSLWLAYLFADSTAIYALGHLSVAGGGGSPREHMLVAFWAPFLLLHLGGPDNITAYALEDNRLWLRHLQTLAVQAVGAAYVVYKHIARGGGGGTSSVLLLAASVCMFAAALVKYGERVWALKCGNMSSLGSSSSDQDVESHEEEENSNNSHVIQVEVRRTEIGLEEEEENSNNSNIIQVEGRSSRHCMQSGLEDMELEELGGGGGEEEEEEEEEEAEEASSHRTHSALEDMELEALIGSEEEEASSHNGKEGKNNDEEILLEAHSHFDICKAAFIDAEKRDPQHPLNSYDIAGLFKLVEMELSLMYDVLYTKAAVIHTWYGFCIHSVSLLATAAALVLFQLSITRGDTYSSSSSRVDVIISYVLLAGALALEAMSLCRAIMSSWTCALLSRLDGRPWKWLRDAISSLRRRLKPASRRLWSGSIGQYNLLDLSADRSGIMCWLAKKVGLERRWNEFHFSSTFSGADRCSVEDLKALVLGELDRTRSEGDGSRVIYSSAGTAALERHRCERYRWSVDATELDKSILIWHVVTDLVIRVPIDGDKRMSSNRLATATRVLSDYMMYLLVVKPEMLPGRTRRNVYLDACKALGRCWGKCSKEWSPGGRGEIEEAAVSSRPRAADMLATWLRADLFPEVSRMMSSKEPHHRSDIKGPRKHAECVYCAIWIYEDIRMRLRDKDKCLEMIFQLWVEMMMHVGERCMRDSHARQLSHGGEFITIMWVITHHVGLLT